jgi:secreted Zn-dependent insulinase-like peptidase
MKRYSDLMIDPLMSKDYMLKEINAVHSEYVGEVSDHEWRVSEVIRSIAVPNGFAASFG